MKIRVANYKEGIPEALQYQCEANELEVSFDDMRFLTPVDVQGTVEREEKSLRFYGKVSAQVVRVCGRTLVEVEEGWEVDFDWFFETENLEYVDPDSELRELIFLDHPMVYRAPTATTPVEYTDIETKKKSPFEELKQLEKDALGNAQKHSKDKKRST